MLNTMPKAPNTPINIMPKVPDSPIVLKTPQEKRNMYLSNYNKLLYNIYVKMLKKCPRNDPEINQMNKELIELSSKIALIDKKGGAKRKTNKNKKTIKKKKTNKKRY